MTHDFPTPRRTIMDRMVHGMPCLSFSVLAITAILFLAGCGDDQQTKSEYEVQDDSDASQVGVPKPAGTPTGRGSDAGRSTSLPKPPPISAQSLNELTIPENATPIQLKQFIDLAMRPSGRAMNPADAARDTNERIAKSVTAAERILVHPSAKSIERQEAVQLKFMLLNEMAQRGVDSAKEHMVTFAGALSNDKDPLIVKLGRMMSFHLVVAEAVEDDAVSFDSVVGELKAIVNEVEPSPEILNQLVIATFEVFKASDSKSGRNCVDSIVATYGKKPEYEQQMKDLLERTLYLELQLSDTLLEYNNGKDELKDVLRNDTLRLLAQENPGPTTLREVIMIGNSLERKGEFDIVKGLYTEVERAYADVKDPKFKVHVDTIRSAAATRFAMMDKPIQLEGITFSGSVFDWKQYQGKTVYVFFWSASDQFFIQYELPKLLQLHRVYKPNGLEFVGVNVDLDVEEVRNFFNFQPMPWTTILAARSEGDLPKQFGVVAFPFALLIDSAGSVVAIHVDSQLLPEKLPALLGTTAGADPSSTDAPAVEETPNPTPDSCQEPAVQDRSADDSTDEGLEIKPLEKTNPYLARKGMNPTQLVSYILKMEDKPTGLRKRPGFKEAIVDAADRVIQSDAPEKLVGIALEQKLRWMHVISMEDDAEEKIQAMLKVARPHLDHPQEGVRQWSEFIVLECEILDIDNIPLEKVTPLLNRLEEFFAEANLDDHHLRLASSAIHAVNRIDVESREEFFQSFGKSFQKSTSRKLASYGKKIAGSKSDSAMTELIGKTLDIRGQTGLGTPIDWESYRGQFVLIDFWATWCGPCMRAAPDIRALYERHHERGFDVVGINLDRDPDALTKYLDKENPPWVNVIAEDAKKISEELGIHAIPALLLVDKEGKVIAVSHSISEIAAALKKAL
jgi:thiol-disulfide isomerase/thioredoxin